MRKIASQTAAAASMPVASLPLEQKQEYRYNEEKKKFEESLRDEMTHYKEYFDAYIQDVGEDGLLNDKKWMDMIIDFPLTLALKEIREHGKSGVVMLWGDRYCPMDAVYSTKRFDIVCWWMDDAHGGMFKYLQALAVVNLSQPYTNDFFERVFSRGTCVDGASSQQTLDATFKMRCWMPTTADWLNWPSQSST